MIFLDLLIILHIFIWCFIIFGGFFGKKYAIYNMKFIIPFIYLIHLLPFHVIVKQKVKFIETNYQKIWNPKFETIKYEIQEANDIGKYLDNKENNGKILQILKGSEQSFFIIKLHHKLMSFFKDSFQNPLSPQGMLILGYIINYYLTNVF